MSNEFELADENPDETLAIEENAENSTGAEAIPEEEEAPVEEEAPLRPPKYKPDSNIYTVLTILSVLAYAVALYVVLDEMRPYCDGAKFLWGMAK